MRKELADGGVGCRMTDNDGWSAMAFGGVLLATLLLGCGAESPQRVVVSGNITYRGQPVRNGQIHFLPTQGTQSPVTGTTISDGRYTVDRKGGVPAGTYRVEIRTISAARRDQESVEDDDHPAPNEPSIPAKYNVNSELRILIEPDRVPITRDFHLNP